MNFADILLIGVGLSMDAFAVALCKGLGMRKFRPGIAAIIALFFGAFQAAMPIIGYFLASRFSTYIEQVDYLVAFALLAIIGGKMIYDACHEPADDKREDCDKLNMKELTLLAVATSIDALAVGIAFACENVRILPSSILIGCTTFLLSFAGVAIGNRFGAMFQKKAQVFGGAVLILIGVKIVLAHFGLLPF